MQALHGASCCIVKDGALNHTGGSRRHRLDQYALPYVKRGVCPCRVLRFKARLLQFGDELRMQSCAHGVE